MAFAVKVAIHNKHNFPPFLLLKLSISYFMQVVLYIKHKNYKYFS